MYMAYGASLRSGDLSRQVGAVILDRKDELVAIGHNDVPRAGGGLYCEEDPVSERSRDWNLGHDANYRKKEEILEDLVSRVVDVCEVDAAELDNRIRSSKVFDITEYGRAVHAEMEALLSAARKGISVDGGTLYSTTFPCHNCAKHIVAAGLKRVVYVEPYPKSQALDLHEDSIALGRTSDQRLHFEPFIGIGPRRFIDLFSMRLSSGGRLRRKKKDGSIVDWKPGKAELRLSEPPQSYIDREDLAVEYLESILPPRTED